MIYHLLCVLVYGAIFGRAQEPSTFVNPVSSKTSSYPIPFTDNVLRVGDFYYLTYVKDGDKIAIIQSPILTSFDDQPESIVYVSKGKLWSSEMVPINGSLYIYFCEETVNKTTEVIKADDSSNPRGTWGPAVNIFQPGENLDIDDGTVMIHDNKLYFLGSQKFREEMFGTHYGILIRPMSSPTQVEKHNGVLIRDGEEWWECNYSGMIFQTCDNVRPSVLYHNATTFVFFAGNTKNPQLATSGLGYASIETGQHPLIRTNWRQAPGTGQAFGMDWDEDVWDVRMASFTTSPDGTETWMLYHAHPNFGNDFKPRIERITWNATTGLPVFPVAHGFNSPQPVPSGQL